MSKAFSRFLVCMTLAGVALSSQPAGARFLLKPKGDMAMPLRVKSLKAQVTIDRQFATTNLEFIFMNESSRRIEADFIYTVPPGAIATYFAYWFGNEKCVARVVEKKRAAEIYRRITSRMRDPALIELIGENTFRARIFPVMPNSDLKIEIRLAHVLPSGEHCFLYELPLREKDRPAGKLDALDVKVRVKADDSIEKIINNYGVPVRKNGDGYSVRLSGTNYRPPKNLRILVVRKKRPFHVAVYAAPSGGPDGFFALALTPDRSLSKPKVTIRGVSTYQVVPARLPAVKAHRLLTVCGRYRGSGEATITLSGRSPRGSWKRSQTVSFGAKREPNNVATKLWAARRIEQLSASEANRSTVIALSTRFGMPSKFTSWLAVPKAEMERYRRELARGDIPHARRHLMTELRKPTPNAKRVKELEERFTELNRTVYGEDYALARTERVALKIELEKLARQVDAATTQGRSKQLTQLAKRQANLRLREEALRARMGDPLISVAAPADAVQVIALLPNGEVKRLAYDPDKRCWEARFDIPAYAPEGQYVITVIIILKDGTRKVVTIRYRVDLTPPMGDGQARVVTAPEPTLRLEVEASDDTARAAALLPWGERIEMEPSAQPHRYFALVPVPPQHRGAMLTVTFVLTDKAHNRTVLTVDATDN